MLRNPRHVVLACLILAPGAQAQVPYNLNYDYYPRTTYVPLGYQLYGWSGWGVPPQIQTELARGMAIYAGANRAREAARAVGAEQQRAAMVRQWNTFYWAAQHAVNLARAGGRLPETSREATASEAELARLRDRPEPEEVASGAALNALLDQITDPRLPAAALRGSSTPLDPALIRQIPYDYASEAVAILLERLTDEARWPRPLALPAISEPRQRFRAAIAAAIAEDLRGPLGEAAVRDVHLALQDLAQAILGAIPPGSPQAAVAEAYLKELVGLARLLGRPDTGPVLGALDDRTGATVEDLLSFMQMFNLRFGEATTPDQEEVYRTLYPILASWRADLSRRLRGPLPRGGVTLAGLRRQAAPALRIFTSMEWDQLLGRPASGRDDTQR